MYAGNNVAAHSLANHILLLCKYLRFIVYTSNNFERIKNAFACANTETLIRAHKRTHTHTHTCTHIHIRTHTHTHIHTRATHTYTQAHTQYKPQLDVVPKEDTRPEGEASQSHGHGGYGHGIEAHNQLRAGE
jgi:hypothetical protein